MTRNGKKLRWSYCAGARGHSRCRVFEHDRTGTLYLETREDGRRVRIALGHRDREAAQATADKTAVALREATATRPPDVTLAALFETYEAEVTPQKGPSSRQHDRRASRLFLECFGAGRKAASLSRRDWDHFITWRRRKGDTRRNQAHPRELSGRAIEHNLKFLVAVLNWAMSSQLLDRNPLRGMPWPRPPSVRRPIVTTEQVAALLAVAPLVHPLALLALVLAYETGHRIGAIRCLRWKDIDFAGRQVRWRAEHDKRRNEHETPLTDAAVLALRNARRFQLGDGWVFPSPGDPSRPVSTNLTRDWWERMESRAGLAHEPGLGWHSLRRLFATELKGQPLVDLCALGGWKDPQTVLKCYMKPDADTQRKALAQRGRLTMNGLGTVRMDTQTDTPALTAEIRRPA